MSPPVDAVERQSLAPVEGGGPHEVDADHLVDVQLSRWRRLACWPNDLVPFAGRALEFPCNLHNFITGIRKFEDPEKLVLMGVSQTFVSSL